MDTFDWNVYLESSKSKQVPEELFSHVEASIFNGIKQGMLLEVCYKNNPDIYWIAEITMVCGHLLRIKFIGASTDFWCDISTTKVHPLGWCGKHEEQIEPPDDINEAHGHTIIEIMTQALLGRVSVSIEALNNKGLSPIDRIKVGMKVEVQNVIDPYRYWIATVADNVGGRLLLRYDGADADLPDTWLFFCSPRLSTFGYVTNKGSPWQFKYPGKVNRFSCKNKLSAQLRLCAEENIKDPTPTDLFQPNQSNLKVHTFVTGMKLEALDPKYMKSIRPATVTKVFNNFHFLVIIDDHIDDYEDSKMAWLCDSLHPYIYPIGWAQTHKVPFTIPKIWTEQEFDWDEYLTMTSSVPAPEYCFGEKPPVKDIEVGMKLEAVNPINHEEIHVANVESIVDHMLCVELLPIGEKAWFSQSSDLLFPVGWCDSNNYELHIPDPNTETPKLIEKPKEDLKKSTEEWCDRIFFNYKCYAGPFMSRNKLAQLPKHVGPGPLSLVLKEVLNKIISASYKPAKLLRDWETEGQPEEGMRLEMLKAKLKSSTYHAYVPVACSAAAVADFCRSVCGKLGACPRLVAPHDHPVCPDNCQQADKAKFQNGTERRGRPKGSVKRRRRKCAQEKKEQLPSHEYESNKDGGESAPESEHSGSTPPSEPGTRPESPGTRPESTGTRPESPGTRPESPDTRPESPGTRPESPGTRPESPGTRPGSPGTRPGSPESIPERRSRKKREIDQRYSKMKTRGAKLPNFAQQMKEAHWEKKDLEINTRSKNKSSDTESSENSRDKNISDVSDSEEPELKKLKFNSHEPMPSDNKLFEKNTAMAWTNGELKLSSNPLEWSVDDVHTYLSNTEDCKLIADRMRQEEIDGQAFIMMDMPIINEFLHLKKEFALHLCKHITMIRWYYIVNFE